MLTVRVKVFASGRRIRFTGLFTSTGEAVSRALDGWPNARAVSARPVLNTKGDTP